MKITLEQALDMYFNEDIDIIIPFEGNFGQNYLRILRKRGYIIVDEEA